MGNCQSQEFVQGNKWVTANGKQLLTQNNIKAFMNTIFVINTHKVSNVRE